MCIGTTSASYTVRPKATVLTDPTPVSGRGRTRKGGLGPGVEAGGLWASDSSEGW